MRFQVPGSRFLTKAGVWLLATLFGLAAPQSLPPLPGLWQGPPPQAAPTNLCDRLPHRAVAGDPPASGLRHWAEPFRELPYEVKYEGNSYLSVTYPPSGGIELWANSWGPGHATNRTVFVRRGPAIDQLTSRETVFDGTLIDDVYALDGSGDLAPTRGFTRPCMYYAPEDGYVLMCCVCPDYLPGRTYLLPALVVSASGQPGTWRYLGMLKGEPEAEAERIRRETGRPPRSDGGTIVKLGHGAWRIYLNGFSPTLAALESTALEGPWRFIRCADGTIRELLPDFPCQGIFPFVLHEAPGRWHTWITDTWPPQSIWHYASADGLTWSRFGRQPEITRHAVAGRGIKCLRAYVEPHSGDIIGLMAVWGRRRDGECGWLDYASRLEGP